MISLLIHFNYAMDAILFVGIYFKIFLLEFNQPGFKSNTFRKKTQIVYFKV